MLHFLDYDGTAVIYTKICTVPFTSASPLAYTPACLPPPTHTLLTSWLPGCNT